jgi:hypothetical protein
MKRREGGRGLLQIETTYKSEIINIAEHLNTKYTEDQFENEVAKAIKQLLILQLKRQQRLQDN